jgi:hypothetical protein
MQGCFAGYQSNSTVSKLRFATTPFARQLVSYPVHSWSVSERQAIEQPS